MLMRSLILAVILALPGCGASQPTGEIVKTVSAGGVLTLNGTPIEFFQVACFPENNRPAIGITNAEGKFTLGTNGLDDGAVPGRHKVAITWIGPPSTNPDEGIMEFTPPPPPTHKLDGKYGNPETSGLTVEVSESGSTDLVIDLK